MGVKANKYMINYGLMIDTIVKLRKIYSDDLENLRSDLASAGLANITRFKDGTSVDFASKVNKTRDMINNLQEKIIKLVNGAIGHSMGMELFENGQDVEIIDESKSASSSNENNGKLMKIDGYLYNMAIKLGHDGADWNKVFKNPDGTTITAQQARTLPDNYEVLYIGNSGVITSGVSSNSMLIGAASLTPVAGLGGLDLTSYDDLIKNEPSEIFNTIYASYDNFKNPFSKSAPYKVVYDENGNIKEESGMVISTPMGYYNNYNNGARHYGNDFTMVGGGSSQGVDINSMADGIVVDVGYKALNNNGETYFTGDLGKDFGNYVAVMSAVKDGDDTKVIVAYYAHMEGRPNVELGQVVTQDTILGQVGNSGNTNGGCHLHHEVVTDLKTKEIENFSIEDLTTYTVKKSNGETITKVRTEDLSTSEAMNKLYGNNGMYNRPTTSERNATYNNEEYAQYVNENSMASAEYNNGMNELVRESTKKEFKYGENGKANDYKARDNINY